MCSHYFTTDAAREFLYTKLHNGFLRAQACPPLDRLFKVPRRAAIAELGARFPPETAKYLSDIPPTENAMLVILHSSVIFLHFFRDKQKREREEQKMRELARQQSNVHPLLIVRVGSGRGLASKDSNGYSDPMLEGTLLDQKYKTRIIKRSLTPHWNETFQFDLTGVNPDLQEVHLFQMTPYLL